MWSLWLASDMMVVQIFSGDGGVNCCRSEDALFLFYFSFHMPVNGSAAVKLNVEVITDRFGRCQTE